MPESLILAGAIILAALGIVNTVVIAEILGRRGGPEIFKLAHRWLGRIFMVLFSAFFVYMIPRVAFLRKHSSKFSDSRFPGNGCFYHLNHQVVRGSTLQGIYDGSTINWRVYNVGDDIDSYEFGGPGTFQAFVSLNLLKDLQCWKQP